MTASQFSKVPRMLLLGFAIVLSLIIPGLAHAQDALPSFDPNTHVYLSAKLANDPTAPVQLKGLENDLKAAGAQQGLQFYFVMVEKGSPIPADANTSNYAVWKVGQFVQANASKLPLDNYVVIMLVRSDRNKTAFSFAANGGNQLQKYGMDARYFSDPNGVLASARAQYLPPDPSGFARAVAAGVNQHIADLKAAELARQQEAARQAAQQKAHEESMRKLPGEIALYGSIFALLAGLLFLTLRFRSHKAKALAVVAEKQTALDSVNEIYLKLQSEYLDFLSDQKGRMSKFKGKTLAAYTAALKDYTEFSVRRQLAVDLNEAAKKAIAGCTFPSVSGFDKAVAMWTTTPIVVTGEEKSLKDVTDVFGGTIEKTTYQPQGLLDSINDLFGRTNKAMAGIVAAFAGAQTNQKSIEALVGKIDGMQPELAANGLNFTPYQATYQELKAQQDGFLAILSSDPLEAFAGSASVETGVEALEQKLERAISIKKSLAETTSAVSKATSRVVEVRGTTVDYKFPVTTPSMYAGYKFTLAESNGNPDPILAEANQHLSNAQAAVLGGELDKAETEKAAAVDASGRAIALVQQVLDAKAYVEKQVPQVRSNLGKLTGDIPGAVTAVAELRAEFLEKNFSSEPGKVTTAQSVADSTQAQIALAQKKYDAQEYLGARAVVEKAGSDVTSSTDALVAVHSRLQQLRDLKQHAKETVVNATQMAAGLVVKLQASSFTTSAATDASFSSLSAPLAAQRKDIAQSVTDWPAAATAADALLAQYKAIDTAIDQQKQAHDVAVSHVNDLSSAIDTATSYVNNNDTRMPARTKLQEAQRALGQVESSLRVPKSDWASIARNADDHKSLATEAQRLAEADHAAANSAREAIQQATTKIEQVEGRSYSEYRNIGGNYSGTFGANVSADCSSASSYLARANSAFQQRNYEDAESAAGSAYRAAGEAEQAAVNATAALIAAAVAAYEEEQRLAREEAERQAQAERDRQAQAERERQAAESQSTSSFSDDNRSGGGEAISDNRSGGGQDQNF